MIVVAEAEALVAAVHRDRERHRSRLPILLEACDPDALLALAEQHRVLPALATALREIPGAARDRLTPPADAAAARSRELAAELVRIVHAMAELDVLAWKGPALAALAHGDVAARTFSDLDLLVVDVPAAEDALARAGCKPVGEAGLSWRTPTGALVDLTRTVPPSPAAELVRRSQRVRLPDGAVPTLSTEDQALAQCVLAASKGWTRLAQVHDLAGLLCRRIDTDALLERAADQGVLRSVSIGLALARDRLGAPISQPLDPEAVADADRAWDGLFPGPPRLRDRLRRLTGLGGLLIG